MAKFTNFVLRFPAIVLLTKRDHLESVPQVRYVDRHRVMQVDDLIERQIRIWNDVNHSSAARPFVGHGGNVYSFVRCVANGRRRRLEVS